MIIVPLSVKVLTWITIALYTSVLGAELMYVRKLCKTLRPSQYHVVSTLQPILLSVAALLYDFTIANPTVVSAANAAQMLGIQLFLLGFGISLYDMCEKRSRKAYNRITVVVAAERRLLNDLASDKLSTGRVSQPLRHGPTSLQGG